MFFSFVCQCVSSKLDKYFRWVCWLKVGTLRMIWGSQLMRACWNRSINYFFLICIWYMVLLLLSSLSLFNLLIWILQTINKVFLHCLRLATCITFVPVQCNWAPLAISPLGQGLKRLQWQHTLQPPFVLLYKEERGWKLCMRGLCFINF